MSVVCDGERLRFIGLLQQKWSCVANKTDFAGWCDWWGLQPGDRRHLRVQLQGGCARTFWFRLRCAEEDDCPHSQHRHPFRSVLTQEWVLIFRKYSVTRRRGGSLGWIVMSVSLKVGMWSRAVQTACSPTCSSLSLLPRSRPPCSGDGTTSWEDGSCHPAWKGSTSSTCLSTPTRTVCYDCKGWRYNDRFQSRLFSLKE